MPWCKSVDLSLHKACGGRKVSGKEIVSEGNSYIQEVNLVYETKLNRVCKTGKLM